MEKIYFKGAEAAKNIEELLTIGYGNFAGKYNYFSLTYSDSDFTKSQCHCARRGFGDLLAICCTYFPETSEKELAKLLVKFYKEKGLISFFCANIGKMVFYHQNSDNKWLLTETLHLYNSPLFYDYVDKYTKEYIEELLKQVKC